MREADLASIVISSYNYARYLRQAIDSALSQTYSHREVIVVDDGSSDESPKIIASYGTQVIPVLKGNGGQASALNAGFAHSRGYGVFFMDSDDVLLPMAVESAMRHLADEAVSKVHWPAWALDAQGHRPGLQIKPNLSDGDVREALLERGPYGYTWPPTTQNAWARPFLEQVLPMPEEQYRTCPDLYLSALAPLYGLVRKMTEPLSCWRLHQQNSSYRGNFDQRLRDGMARDHACLATLDEHRKRLGLAADPQRWLEHCWWPLIGTIVRDIARFVPDGQSFILVDQDEWACEGRVAGRRCLPFPEREGRYWGYLADDAAAIEELERQRKAGAGFIAFVRPHLWWLEQYAGFRQYLEARYARVLADGRLILFDLNHPRIAN